LGLLTKNRFIVVCGDVMLLSTALLCSFLLRFETVPPSAWNLFQVMIIPFTLTKLTVFTLNGLYAGPWRYTGVLDFARIVKSSVISLMLLSLALVFTHYSANYSRSVLLIDTILTILFVGAFRLSIRITYSKQMLKAVLLGAFGTRLWMSKYSDNSKTVMVYGGGEAGEMLIRSILSHQGLVQYHIAGFIDDNPEKKGTIIHGIPYCGSIRDVKQILADHEVEELLITASPKKEVMKEVLLTCQKEKVSCKTVPSYLQGLKQGVEVGNLRDIALEDLLRREPISISYSQVANMVKGKRVLITGAAGSIGSQLCKQILEFEPDELITVDNAETPLFFLRETLRKITGSIKMSFYCSNVTNLPKLKKIFAIHKPELVFHAAAHKHVPLMEDNRDEVIQNNLSGTKNCADMANKFNAEVFVFISTDKAVNPANIMGWTKRAGEIYTASLASNGGTKFLSVRFGNVLGSNGSVVPIFKQQIQDGGPVTLTHEDVTRYFMTIPEAVLLILHAAFLGDYGDTMILDMGKPIKIRELAEDLIRLAGYTPGDEIEITTVGLRPGEKLHEALSLPNEKLAETSNPKISVLKNRFSQWSEVGDLIDTIVAISKVSPDDAYEKLKSSVRQLSPGKDESTLQVDEENRTPLN